MQLSTKQMDLTIASLKIQRQNWETQWATGNVDCFSKKFKNLRCFFDNNWLEELFWQKILQRAAQPTGVSPVTAKVLAFLNLL